VEKVAVDYTPEFFNEDYCKGGLKILSKEVDKWVDKNNTNVITKINEFRCKIKDIFEFSITLFHSKWSRYRKCETYIQKLSAYLLDEYPNKIGADVYKSFKSNR
jgi:hypothetical protein